MGNDRSDIGGNRGVALLVFLGMHGGMSPPIKLVCDGTLQYGFGWIGSFPYP